MIWLVGNKGMLGTELSDRLKASGVAFAGTDREVDILDASAIGAFARGKELEWVVNCAAYTAVDKAEAEVDLCRALNATGPQNLARAAKRMGAKILHVSTDYVFGGTASTPYREDDPVCPQGVYGRTKAEGEELVRLACAEHVIIRTAWLYGRHGPNFVFTMLKLMAEKEKIGVVADQRGTPTNAADLAGAIVSIITAARIEYGTFHFTDRGETSWFEFARAIQALGRKCGILDRECAIEALTTAQYPTKAKRPAYSVLDKNKIMTAYALAIPEWETSLEAFIGEIQAKGTI